jgi:hypothetical protein
MGRLLLMFLAILAILAGSAPVQAGAAARRKKLLGK